MNLQEQHMQTSVTAPIIMMYPSGVNDYWPIICLVFIRYCRPCCLV